MNNREPWKLCRLCGKLKPSFDFYGRQARCKECIGILSDEYREKTYSPSARSEWRQIRKFKIIHHYSKGTMICARCGFSDIRALSIDHIDGGGTQHRKLIGDLYGWLNKNNYPEGFRVLCMNCQLIKSYENNEHPYHSAPLSSTRSALLLEKLKEV